MSLFMRMVVTAGVVTCALVTSAHATWNAQRSGILGARWKMLGWNDIGRTCGSPWRDDD